MQKKKIHILLAEDDQNLGNLLCEYLEAKGYAVELARDGQEAGKLFGEQAFDLCILDIMMPVKDGFTLAKEIRKVDQDVPVIFLTAKSMKEDTLEGFKLGADDYITKPFSMEELLMRMKAIMRRVKGGERKVNKSSFELGKYHFDYAQQLLICDGKQQKLTSRENELLRLLCLHENEVMERTYALKNIWEDDNYFNARSMDVYIAKLRKHLKDDPSIQILNVHGKGFKLLQKS